mmetsp:Transcript_108748/g.306462  ORF Transcript_108748/g.306462 Transcript_108748/m.306462 type:complete len:282 (+) Transcript_108748:1009-1854(+)
MATVLMRSFCAASRSSSAHASRPERARRLCDMASVTRALCAARVLSNSSSRHASRSVNRATRADMSSNRQTRGATQCSSALASPTISLAGSMRASAKSRSSVATRPRAASANCSARYAASNSLLNKATCPASAACCSLLSCSSSARRGSDQSSFGSCAMARVTRNIAACSCCSFLMCAESARIVRSADACSCWQLCRLAAFFRTSLNSASWTSCRSHCLEALRRRSAVVFLNSWVNGVHSSCTASSALCKAAVSECCRRSCTANSPLNPATSASKLRSCIW